MNIVNHFDWIGHLANHFVWISYLLKMKSIYLGHYTCTSNALNSRLRFGISPSGVLKTLQGLSCFCSYLLLCSGRQIYGYLPIISFILQHFYLKLKMVFHCVITRSCRMCCVSAGGSEIWGGKVAFLHVLLPVKPSAG